MNVRDQLLAQHSKANTNLIVEWVGSDARRFAEVLQIFLGEDYRLVQRSAWVVGEIGLKQPELLAPHTTALLRALRAPLHPAVQRNGLRLIAESGLRLPEEEEGQLVDLAFELLAAPRVPVAIRVHAMQVLANLCEPYPELVIELQPYLEDALKSSSAGMRSRAKRLWAKLYKHL
ncbi:MAG: hypothetical protein D6772_03870 [Bacteroidetes bacterium]|nr:MAG: hypothetical protein D6772_03870 [Bacteroidota bacterium]